MKNDEFKNIKEILEEIIKFKIISIINVDHVIIVYGKFMEQSINFKDNFNIEEKKLKQYNIKCKVGTIFYGFYYKKDNWEKIEFKSEEDYKKYMKENKINSRF